MSGVPRCYWCIAVLQQQTYYCILLNPLLSLNSPSINGQTVNSLLRFCAAFGTAEVLGSSGRLCSPAL